MKNLNDLIKVAKGEAPPDLLLKNGSLVNVYSGEIYPTDIAVYDEYIIGVGKGYEDAKETVDLSLLHIMPGFFDAHIHIETSMV